MRSRSRLVRRSPVAPKTSRSPRKAPAAPAVAPVPGALAHPAATPVVKWVGGKTRLLPELRARMPERIGRYYEPFAGGAALFFATQPGHAVLSDFNRDLIGTYRAVATDVDALMRRLELHRKAHSDEHYYGMRARWNDGSVSWTPVDRAAAFIYLNKTCYNGLWRVNRSGAFNVPVGRYVEPTIFSSEGLRAAAAVLASAELRCGDFRRAVDDAGKGDFVYFDPPYDPLTKTANFTSYTAGSFGDDDQRELAELVRTLVGRGCRVMLSNSDTPFIRSLYKGLRVDRVSCARAINSNASRRGAVDEVVVTAGY
ncbi:MAG: DNA adenine methylase [Deltaproteobacteria bacterium]|nr:DNA adenine methylase [Deltaproteobacteria bacterium]